MALTQPHTCEKLVCCWDQLCLIPVSLSRAIFGERPEQLSSLPLQPLMTVRQGSPGTCGHQGKVRLEEVKHESSSPPVSCSPRGRSGRQEGDRSVWPALVLPDFWREGCEWHILEPCSELSILSLSSCHFTPYRFSKLVPGLQKPCLPGTHWPCPPRLHVCIKCAEETFILNIHA